MAHPYSNQAKSSQKSKASTMGKSGNLDLPIMRAVGENNSKKLYSSSSSSQQHKDQSAADGMKRGGHVGKPKHHKPKVVMVAPEATANPPSPDPSMAAAGMGSSPVPAPPPGMPPMKRGGKVMGHKYKGGAGSGVGRLEETKQYGLKPIKG